MTPCSICYRHHSSDVDCDGEWLDDEGPSDGAATDAYLIGVAISSVRPQDLSHHNPSEIPESPNTHDTDVTPTTP